MRETVERERREGGEAGEAEGRGEGERREGGRVVEGDGRGRGRGREIKQFL